ncbi:ABC transporter permease [Ferrimonas senticii]|uniref:ABC transporter permease n=1 Tax=Ferrimonas senticii TaxID=394566 RepID=UPI000415F454|nr:ABC transporter permease [Ferrimonas senticii]
MNIISIIAAKEFRDGVRSRWVLLLSVLLTALSLLICHFGGAGSGSAEVLPLPQLLISLSTLLAVMVPLIAILLSYDAVVGEQEQGTLLLLLSYPLSRSQLLWGKFVGLGAILVTTLLIAMLISAGSLVNKVDALLPLLLGLAQLTLNAMLLGLVFMALALWLSSRVISKGRALAQLFALWFVLVLLWDLGVLALLVADLGMPQWARMLMLVNPVDLFRLTTVLAQQPETINGVMALLSGSGWHWSLASLGLLLWLTLFGLLARWQLRCKWL